MGRNKRLWQRGLTPSCRRNLFMPLSSVCGALAVHSMPGWPS